MTLIWGVMVVLISACWPLGMGTAYGQEEVSGSFAQRFQVGLDALQDPESTFEDYEKAQRLFESLADTTEDTKKKHACYFNQFHALVKLGQYEKALEQLKQAYYLRPDHGPTLENLEWIAEVLKKQDPWQQQAPESARPEQGAREGGEEDRGGRDGGGRGGRESDRESGEDKAKRQEQRQREDEAEGTSEPETLQGHGQGDGQAGAQGSEGLGDDQKQDSDRDVTKNSHGDTGGAPQDQQQGEELGSGRDREEEEREGEQSQASFSSESEGKKDGDKDKKEGEDARAYGQGREMTAEQADALLEALEKDSSYYGRQRGSDRSGDGSGRKKAW